MNKKENVKVFFEKSVSQVTKIGMIPPGKSAGKFCKVLNVNLFTFGIHASLFTIIH